MPPAVATSSLLPLISPAAQVLTPLQADSATQRLDQHVHATIAPAHQLPLAPHHGHGHDRLGRASGRLPRQTAGTAQAGGDGSRRPAGGPAFHAQRGAGLRRPLEYRPPLQGRGLAPLALQCHAAVLPPHRALVEGGDPRQSGGSPPTTNASSPSPPGRFLTCSPPATAPSPIRWCSNTPSAKAARTCGAAWPICRRTCNGP